MNIYNTEPKKTERALLAADIFGGVHILATDGWSVWNAADIIGSDAEECGLIDECEKFIPGLYLWTGTVRLEYENHEAITPTEPVYEGTVRPVVPNELAELLAMTPPDEVKECNPSKGMQPIDMILVCPVCDLQHIDQPNPAHDLYRDGDKDIPRSILDQNGQVVLSLCKRCGRGESELEEPCWTNPPHKSHLCARCGTIWRPADVPTNGVESIHTRGEKDTWTPSNRRPLSCPVEIPQTEEKKSDE